MPTLPRRTFLSSLGAGAAAFGLSQRRFVFSADSQRPNILFLMSDQHRWDFLGCMRHPLVQTPTLRPPRRARHAVRHGLHPMARLCPLAHVAHHGPLSTQSRRAGQSLRTAADQQTIGHHLKSLGYQTAAIGKMHFVDKDQQHGFDYRVEKLEYSDETGATFPNAQIRTRDGKEWGISSQTEGQTYEHYLADKTIKWLEKNGDKPFCIWCSMVAPHPPFVAPESLYKLYEGKVKLPPQPRALGRSHRRRRPHRHDGLSGQDHSGGHGSDVLRSARSADACHRPGPKPRAAFRGQNRRLAQHRLCRNARLRHRPHAAIQMQRRERQGARTLRRGERPAGVEQSRGQTGERESRRRDGKARQRLDGGHAAKPAKKK